MLRSTMTDLKTRHAAFAAWTNRHWPALRVPGHALAFAIVFGGATLAAHHSGYSPTLASVCGVLFILFVRLYARSIPRVQRLIDRLHPEPDDPAKPDEIPGWAVGVYILAGLAVACTVGALQDTYTHAPMELFVAWGVGRNLLDLFWCKRDGTTAFGTAFEAFDQRLDDWAAGHRPLLGVLRTALWFVLLFGGVGTHAYESGFADAAAATCGAPCLSVPGIKYLAAAACGAAAILFVALYARLTSELQRVTADPWKFVRPEPPGTKVPFWVAALHVLLGLVLFGAMAVLGQEQPPGRFVINLRDCGTLALIFGWWIGGRGILRFFWAKLPRGGGFTHERSVAARRK
jgi:hypothetical protein